MISLKSIPQKIVQHSFDQILHDILNNTEIVSSISRAIQEKRKTLATTFTETEIDSLLNSIEQKKNVRPSLISKLFRFFSPLVVRKRY